MKAPVLNWAGAFYCFKCS